jgi:signal transduction histidine kinase/ActR/RegA family two-component response regulator
VPWRGSRPLRFELALLVGLGVLPLALLGGWGIWSTVHRQGTEISRSALELSRALASAVDSELDATVESLTALSNARSLERGDLRQFYDTVSEEVRARPAWQAVLLADAQGQPLFKTGAPYGEPDPRIVDPDSLRRTLATGRMTVGSLLKGPHDVYALPVRVPVFKEGRLAFVLTAAVKPDRFVEIVSNQRVPSDWIISVFDSTNLRVARSRDQAATVGTRPGRSLEQLMTKSQGSGAGLTRTIEGDEVYTGYTKVEAYGWTVAVGASTAGTSYAIFRSLGLYAFGVMLSALACGALAVRVTRRVSRDMGSIRWQAVRVGAGESIAPMHSDIAEIDEMAAALHAASKRLEAASAAASDALRRADAASRTKDEFLAVLGHELRNPLAPMLTALHLMDAKADASTARERQVMKRQIAHMRRLVDDLLDVARIARGTLQIHREPVELRGVVDRAVETVQPALAAQRRELVVRMPEFPLWVEGDETRLVQAVTNLLTNGVRFGGDAPLSLALLRHADAARIVVRDEGVGIGEDALGHVFEPFYQAPQSLARTSGGLAIVRTVVELHGGEVQAASDGIGKGSRFEIRLPTIAVPAQSEAPVPAAAAATAGRVLVVDDNVDSSTTLADVLAAAGHEVKIALTGAEAVAVAARFAPHAAILDIGLPDMSGYELARRLRATPGWHGCLIALTGYGQATDKALAAQAGFDQHFTKPAELSSLLRAVDEAMIVPGAPQAGRVTPSSLPPAGA